MKPILILSLLSLIIQFTEAAFMPYSLESKTKNADLIIQAKVISVTRLLPENNRTGAKGTKGSYMGPQSIAVVEIKNVWKYPKRSRFLSEVESKIIEMPKYIMIPCGYTFMESPSDLTANTTYIMFLRESGANIYHPLGTACTHVIDKDRIANFGMNHPPRKDWEAKSILLSTFKSKVDKSIASQEKAKYDATKPTK